MVKTSVRKRKIDEYQRIRRKYKVDQQNIEKQIIDNNKNIDSNHYSLSHIFELSLLIILGLFVSEIMIKWIIPNKGALMSGKYTLTKLFVFPGILYEIIYVFFFYKKRKMGTFEYVTYDLDMVIVDWAFLVYSFIKIISEAYPTEKYKACIFFGMLFGASFLAFITIPNSLYGNNHLPCNNLLMWVCVVPYLVLLLILFANHV